MLRRKVGFGAAGLSARVLRMDGSARERWARARGAFGVNGGRLGSSSGTERWCWGFACCGVGGLLSRLLRPKVQGVRRPRCEVSFGLVRVAFR